MKKLKPPTELHVLRLLQEMGIPADEWADPSLDLDKTPGRVVKMLRHELLAGYLPGALEDLTSRFTTFPADGKDALITIANIDYTSLCAHHMLPFAGVASVGYLPADRIVGASKIPRVVEHYSHMFQNQERLSRQVVDFIFQKAGAKFVIGIFEAAHECMRCRGVGQRNARMVTTAIQNREDVEYSALISEFYKQLNFLKGTKR